MFIKTAFRAPFYFFAGEEPAAGGEGGGSEPVNAGVAGANAARGAGPPVDTGAAKVEPVQTAVADPKVTPPVTPPVEKKPAAPEQKTAIEGAGVKPGEEPVVATQTWPDDWATRAAKGDKKLADRLIKMGSPEAVVDAYRNLEQKMSSGAYAKKLPTNYTAEEVTEFRKANGIPEKAEEYDDNIGGGIVWGDADKPHIDNVKQYALEHNWTPDQLKSGLGWWAQYQNELSDQLIASDNNTATLARDEYRRMWGPKLDANFTFVKNQFEALGSDEWKAFVNGRDANGVRFGDNPKVMNAMYQAFYKADPRAAELPANGTPPAQAESVERTKLETMMRADPYSYWKGPDAAKNQERYRQIIQNDLDRGKNAA